MRNATEKIRVMWLLNHRTARGFDVAMLQSLGIREIFLPKSFPANYRYVSADVDNSFDSALTIPKRDLAVLNEAAWYDRASAEAWEIANRHFQVAFIGFDLPQVEDVTRHFKSTVVLRAFGHLGQSSFFSDALYREIGHAAVGRIVAMNERFWFGQAYEHLHDTEHQFLRSRNCYLPLGLVDATVNDRWQGDDARILFVCPQIGTTPYYESIYKKFLEDFRGLPYLVAGAQPIKVPDPNVLGLIPREQYEENMRRCRVMFYSDAHPNNLRHHPFEAIRAGMPLVFMAGSLLDRLGGEHLPGRCRTMKEARQKIERLLSGDDRLAKRIREKQAALLEKMRPEYCAPIWRRNFENVLASSNSEAVMVQSSARSRRKIAVILPLEYRGGTLRAAKLIATALYLGSRQAGEPADIVFGHLDVADSYPDEEFSDLPPEILRRCFRWELLDRAAAERIARYQGHEITLDDATFAVPNDGINHFLDCDIWLIVSDRLTAPLLPLKPYALVVFDYIQRYQFIMPDDADITYLRAARNASAVLVTTRFTRDDAAQYAGVRPKSIHLVPCLLSAFPQRTPSAEEHQRYFIWPTNLAPHKNHTNSLRALRYYYEALDGAFQCRVTGVESESIFNSDAKHLKEARAIFDSSDALENNLILMGELPDPAYQKLLAGSSFLWHSTLVDNGTFSVVEAASVGVPALSSDYPAMREMNDLFDLNLAWCDPTAPRQMALQLKRMETAADDLRHKLPNRQSLETKAVEHVASAYWQAVRTCL